MPSHAAPTASVKNALRRFRRNRRASAAVEFALIAPMFFALLFGLIETGILFFADQVLETATQNAARLILTGQAQGTSMTAAQFQSAVCGQIPGTIFNCTNLSVDVQNYPQFSNVTISSQIDGSGHFINNMKYCPGNSKSIVVVRVFYPWQLFVIGLGYNISNMAGGQRLLAATAAFRNEPSFSAPPSSC
jgi:Flp pilus assembly protein TadG